MKRSWWVLAVAGLFSACAAGSDGVEYQPPPSLSPSPTPGTSPTPDPCTCPGDAFAFGESGTDAANRVVFGDNGLLLVGGTTEVASGASEGRVHAISSTTDNPWSVSIGYGPVTALDANAGRVFAAGVRTDGTDGIFLTAWDQTNGGSLWEQLLPTGTANVEITGVAVSSVVALVGWFTGGTIELSPTDSVTAITDRQLLVAAYDATNGQLVWFRTFTSTSGVVTSEAIGMDGSTLVVAGEAQGTVTFDAFDVTGTFFAAGIDLATGDATFGVPGSVSGGLISGIDMDSAGNVYFATALAIQRVSAAGAVDWEMMSAPAAGLVIGPSAAYYVVTNEQECTLLTVETMNLADGSSLGSVDVLRAPTQGLVAFFLAHTALSAGGEIAFAGGYGGDLDVIDHRTSPDGTNMLVYRVPSP